jgi:hypothetical protein
MLGMTVRCIEYHSSFNHHRHGEENHLFRIAFIILETVALKDYYKKMMRSASLFVLLLSNTLAFASAWREFGRRPLRPQLKRTNNPQKDDSKLDIFDRGDGPGIGILRE